MRVYWQCLSSFSFGMKKGKYTRILLSSPVHCLHQTTKALNVTIRMNVYLVFISRNGSVFHLENDSEGNCYVAVIADYNDDCICARVRCVLILPQTSFHRLLTLLPLPFIAVCQHIRIPLQPFSVSCFNEYVHLKKNTNSWTMSTYFFDQVFLYRFCRLKYNNINTCFVRLLNTK